MMTHPDFTYKPEHIDQSVVFKDFVGVIFVIFCHLCLVVEYTDILFTFGEFLSRWPTSSKRILSAPPAENWVTCRISSEVFRQSGSQLVGGGT